MTLPYRLHPLAEDDLVAAWSWYEAQVPGLGDRFLDVVLSTLESVVKRPNAGAPMVHDPAGEVVERKAATTGFPYAIRYRTIGDAIVVLAVHHQRRHPDAGTGRAL